jgi:hypothetical protein
MLCFIAALCAAFPVAIFLKNLLLLRVSNEQIGEESLAISAEHLVFVGILAILALTFGAVILAYCSSTGGLVRQRSDRIV